MKLVAIIVAYEPNIQQMQNNVLALIEDVDKLLVYKNSNFEFSDLIIQKYYDKIEFIGDAVNVGIATALNEGVKWALHNSYTHILTLDQDSFFEKFHLNKFKEIIEDFKLHKIGIYCPNIDNRGSLLVNDVGVKFVYFPDSITSGSIFPLNIFKDFGMFEDDLFIDAVDYEFCYRIFSNKGFRTVVFPEIILRHEVGHMAKIKFGFHSDNYSAFRTYFIIRNHILIWRRYPDLFQKNYKITLIRIHIFYRIAKIIIGEEDKIAKLRSILRGIYHGLVFKSIKK